MAGRLPLYFRRSSRPTKLRILLKFTLPGVTSASKPYVPVEYPTESFALLEKSPYRCVERHRLWRTQEL